MLSEERHHYGDKLYLRKFPSWAYTWAISPGKKCAFGRLDEFSGVARRRSVWLGN